jgi:cell division protease FtsH
LSQHLSRSDLLRLIRAGQVARVGLFDTQDRSRDRPGTPADPSDESRVMRPLPADGAALVQMADGTLATAVMPPPDVRLWVAAEACGVPALRLPASGDWLVPPPRPPPPAWAGWVNDATPYLMLVSIWAAAQLAAWARGDSGDRAKLRAADVAKEAASRAEAAEDSARLALEEMAAKGFTAREIEGEAARQGRAVARPYLEALVAAAAAQAAADAASGAGGMFGPAYEYNTDAASQAEALREAALKAAGGVGGGGDGDAANPADALDAKRRMSTVKVTPAAAKGRAPPAGGKVGEEKRFGGLTREEAWGGGPATGDAAGDDDTTSNTRARMREAQRRLRGVKLQYTGDRPITFADVAGVDAAQTELAEVVDFFVRPGRFAASGARVPRGVLLCGPPGTGKTLLARAVAGEAGAAFLSLNASEFVEMFVGVGAARVRDLFAQARGMAPSIIFIDELDAVGRTRGGAQGNDERDATLNQLLTEMDGFGGGGAAAGGPRVVVIAATNRLDVLDPALVRPGRFDRIAAVPHPSAAGRVELLKLYLRADKPDERRCEDAGMDWARLAAATAGYSGASIAQAVNAAAIAAADAGADRISTDHVLAAVENDTLGPARPAASGARAARVALIEAAASLVITLTPGLEPVIFSTVVPRDRFPVGRTVISADPTREETGTVSRAYLEAQLTALLAGYAAEALTYAADDRSSLPAPRLAQARTVANKLVVGAGLVPVEALASPAAAAAGTGPAPGALALPVPGPSGLNYSIPSSLSDADRGVVGAAVQAALDEGLARATGLLTRNRGALDALVGALLSRSSLDGAEVARIVREHADPADWAAAEAGREGFL